MNEPWKGFVFLDVHRDLLEETHDLGFGLTLRKATLEEISNTQVEYSFRSWSERRGTSIFINQRMPLADKDKNYSGSITSNFNEWRHAVIECQNKNIFFNNVNLAFSLSGADLRMGLIRIGSDKFSTPFTEFPMLNIRNSLGAMFVDHDLPSKKDLPEIKENISHVLKNITPDFPSEIRDIINIFSSLDNLPDSAQLKMLGYFAVIEGLLSHSPQGSDSVDSIQRQLIRNIRLLNHRLKDINREISFSEFGGTNMDKIIKRLYAYRSSIAHGGNSESSLADLNKIRQKNNTNNDHLWLHDWMRNMTKKLILAAITEPILVIDLK